MINILSVFILSAFLAGIIIPKILLISFRKKLFDTPDERKIHHLPIPRLGGLAFTPVILFTIAFILGLNLILKENGDILHMNEIATELIFEFCALLLLYIIGMADDLIGVKYSAKFVVQILCGILLVTGGVYINNLHGLFGIYELPLWVGYMLSILVIVFFTNAINLIDGVDGLASGLSIATSIFYTITFIFLDSYLYAAIAAAVLGVLVPFYYYNVFGNAERGKKIFMGDTGSLTLGFSLSFLSIKLLSCANYEVINHPNPFILAFAPMLVPCLDVLRVFFRRIRHHKSPFLPDRTHIHHKLMALGLSTRKTMVTIVGIAILLSSINIYLSLFINITLLLIGNILLWIYINLLMTRQIKKCNINCDFNK